MAEVSLHPFRTVSTCASLFVIPILWKSWSKLDACKKTVDFSEINLDGTYVKISIRRNVAISFEEAVNIIFQIVVRFNVHGKLSYVTMAKLCSSSQVLFRTKCCIGFIFLFDVWTLKSLKFQLFLDNSCILASYQTLVDFLRNFLVTVIQRSNGRFELFEHRWVRFKQLGTIWRGVYWT